MPKPLGRAAKNLSNELRAETEEAYPKVMQNNQAAYNRLYKEGGNSGGTTLVSVEESF